MLALSSLNSQPVPGWAIKSDINNSSSQSKEIDLGINTSEDKSNQNNSFNNAVNDSSSSAAGQNKNYENRNENSAEAENKFSKAEQREIEKLNRRDREVRAHEMAHQSAGGQYAGSASYSYTTGPDNRRYAVGGSVDIETSPAKTPEETVKKAEQIKRAATAPAKPSAADLQIAAKAARMKMEAQAELNQKEISGENEENEKSDEINKNATPQFENKYLLNKRENSYQNSSREISVNQGLAA